MTFREEMRYEYQLTSASVVMDLGMYQGTFTAGILERYGCTIHGFEPVPTFADQCNIRFVDRPGQLFIHRYAVGGCTRRLDHDEFKQANDSSGMFCHCGFPVPDVEVRGIADVLKDLGLAEVDLIKINIEGMEYALLDAMLDQDLVKRFKNIQVQFHQVMANCEERRLSIHRDLLKSHRTTYDFPYVWTNYERLA